MEGKTFALSGFDNVTWGVAKKLEDLGAMVITLSGPDGYIYDPKGVTCKKVEHLLEMRNSGCDKLKATPTTTAVRSTRTRSRGVCRRTCTCRARRRTT